MRKFSIIICLIIAILSLCLSASTPPLDQSVIRTIHPKTNLYTTASLQNNVVIILPQNAFVTLIGEPFYQSELLWQEINYEQYNGFVLYNNLYVSLRNDTYSMRIVKATSKAMGQEIALYVTHDITSEHITVCDGTKLNLIVTDIDYGNFSKVEYLGNTYYVISTEITSGLSYNQTIAVIISSALCGAVLIAVFLTVIIKKSKLSKIK